LASPPPRAEAQEGGRGKSDLIWGDGSLGKGWDGRKEGGMGWEEMKEGGGKVAASSASFLHQGEEEGVDGMRWNEMAL